MDRLTCSLATVFPEQYPLQRKNRLCKKTCSCFPMENAYIIIFEGSVGGGRWTRDRWKPGVWWGWRAGYLRYSLSLSSFIFCLYQ